MATVASDRAVHAAGSTATAGYSKTSRRQYQACDQCRKSRRACDAGALRVVNFPFRESDQLDSSASTCEACSNCARTSKTCTFDWLRTLPLQGLPKGVKRKLESTGLPECVTNPATAPETNLQPPYSNGYSSFSDTISYSQFASTSQSFHSSTVLETGENGTTESRESTYVRTGPLADCPSVSDVHYRRDMNGSQAAPSTASMRKVAAAPVRTVVGDVVFSNHSVFGESAFHNRWNDLPLVHRDSSSTSPGSNSNSNDSSNAMSKIGSSPSLTSISSETSGEDDAANTYSTTERAKRARNPHGYHDSASTDRGSPESTRSKVPSNSSALSSNGRRQNSAPLSTGQLRFADTAMKAMIASGLLRIYHDSFENSLSCWVTERNCPYETELRDLIPHASPASTAEEAALRLGDNRIFSRVCRLDSAFSLLRGRELSPMENRAATKALNAAIMAFASQWSHGSHNSFWKSKEGMSQMKAFKTHSGGLFARSGRPNDPMLTSECERMIQKTLWHDAKKAIQSSSEIDSFKVILAYMIFALTQRPIDGTAKSTPDAQTSPADSSTNSRRGSDNSSLYEPVSQGADPAMDSIVNEEWNPFYASDLEALASPPIYLETAVRNLFSWRRKIERYRRLRSKANGNYGHGSMGALALKDHQTFNLLFWLGVMCDTTSSAISKRPLVIGDEDCAMIREDVGDSDGVGLGGHDQYLPFNENQDYDHDKRGLWGDYLLSFKWAGPRKTQPRWPCTFDEAALVLQEAIPVKVLMFRKVAQLQTLAFRRTRPQELEKCIQDALKVYEQWNETYRPFMNDCVSQHNFLDPHVQSWYVILDGHWHYGCLLLADTISQIDREEKTMEPQRMLRAKFHLIKELRHDNAVAIAKIAQASLSEHKPSVPDNPDFHFVCNGSAILTEPWTDILVRAMGSACKVFLTWLSSWNNPTNPGHEWVHAHTDYQDLYTQAEACIQGMSLLGRKSDAANYTAEVFWTRFSQVCSSRRSSVEVFQEE
ncbi:uncharacterized protein Z519_07525 [Cladophialophora bantiana CBS 173.52]|uniref:Zn(2)-C6 fungal-type domain-containing protein n=1 Tax=Cladophialophora bantiana (strain ATCC 10958 / CBS 173.52 / CDC B-1940 / NIH 8579) TaxID=1442370 RepID=A0A0D2HE52_CLAB1|nr:uncharacterized protein Z519_07525 [Cladophialophora bantiana CBS 173.52]KIW91558.1 hypothetical protein Z519_07525 [Cladophialophora bantiana CBS 173.52]